MCEIVIDSYDLKAFALSSIKTVFLQQEKEAEIITRVDFKL